MIQVTKIEQFHLFSSFQLNSDVQKRPIHFVIDSICHDNLSALLNDPSVNVDAEHNSLTPINILVELISESNFDTVFSCIKLLVKHCANVNIPDQNGLTPIIKILDCDELNTVNKQVIVKYFLENAIIDIDSDESVETRNKLTKLLPDLILPPVQNGNHHNWTFDRLMTSLKAEDETKFLKDINFITVKNPKQLEELITDNGDTLLLYAAKMDLSVAVEKILRLGVNINATFKTASAETYGIAAEIYAVDYACICGHYRVLEVLLRSSRLKCKKGLVSNFVKYNNDQVENKCGKRKYENCFRFLVTHPNIDINGEDQEGLTALHYAIKYNNSTIIQLLLYNGAYIGIKNSWGCSIFNMNSQVLEEHFDRCITATYRKDTTSPELTFCYENLVPNESMRQSSEKMLYEMTAVELLSNSNELKHLIKHPLIMSFFWFKWKRLAPFFYINLFFCALFDVTSVSYILFCYLDENKSVTIQTMTLLLMIYIVARELVQLIFSPRIYLSSFDNYLESAVIVLMLIILFDLGFDEWRRTIAATTIILMACGIFVLVGSLPIPAFGVHFVMLETVGKNFLKGLSLYSIIIIAFALSFYASFHEPMPSSKNSTISGVSHSSKSHSECEHEYHKFSSIGLSLLKTVVMTIGELDAGSIDFNANTSSYLIFVVFILAVTTVLANLLNGLAVSDINTVKSEAELLYLIRRCQVLARYEKVFWNKKFNEKFCIKFPFNLNLFRAFHTKYEISFKTQHYKVRTNGVVREIIDASFNMFAKYKVEKEDEMDREWFQNKISAIADDMQSLGELMSDKFCVMENRFSAMEQKNELIENSVRTLFERSAIDNIRLNERISRIESTLKTLCDTLT